MLGRKYEGERNVVPQDLAPSFFGVYWFGHSTRFPGVFFDSFSKTIGSVQFFWAKNTSVSLISHFWLEGGGMIGLLFDLVAIAASVFTCYA